VLFYFLSYDSLLLFIIARGVGYFSPQDSSLFFIPCFSPEMIYQDRTSSTFSAIWEQWQLLRISALSDDQVRIELGEIMRGINYSWQTISQQLRLKFNSGVLQLENFQGGNTLYEWNVLCDEKVYWEYHGQPSFQSFRFNRDCLLKLKTIPTHVGLGKEGRFSCRTYDHERNNNLETGIRLTTMNIDGLVPFKDRIVVAPCKNGLQGLELSEGNEEYFYPEGPEFRLEYIHNRVEW